MDEKAKAWNMNDLESLVKYSIGNKCKGVNTPYVYIGSWKTFFAWHK
jgi:jumonji domain-containing protein 2